MRTQGRPGSEKVSRPACTHNRSPPPRHWQPQHTLKAPRTVLPSSRPLSPPPRRPPVPARPLTWPRTGRGCSSSSVSPRPDQPQPTRGCAGRRAGPRWPRGCGSGPWPPRRLKRRPGSCALLEAAQGCRQCPGASRAGPGL